ncbi:MAG: 50S ribosomal protein L21 [bacterium]|nr:50S ribosomal protein L21 [bacterium]
MFAVIQTGGKQYIVKEGDKLKIEKIEGEPSNEITFDTVLLKTDEEGNDLVLGLPTIGDAQVKATIVEQGRGKKIDIIKYKPKVRYRRKNGHRQPFTTVQITSI